MNALIFTFFVGVVLPLTLSGGVPTSRVLRNAEVEKQTFVIAVNRRDSQVGSFGTQIFFGLFLLQDMSTHFWHS